VEDKDPLEYTAMKSLFRWYLLCILVLIRYFNFPVIELNNKLSQERICF